MKVTRAVITAAARKQRTLPLQTLIDRDGIEKSVLNILINEIVQAGIEEICVVVHPGDETAYADVAGDHVGRLRFVQQPDPYGYGHAIYRAREFTGREPFLHLVGDHLFVSRDEQSCAQHLVEIAEAEACIVSAVQATRESLLPYFGVVSGQRMAGHPDLYQVDTVIEKPTPTEAEQRLIASGLRAGHYLCFFGMHVLAPTVMDVLGEQLKTVQQNESLAAQTRVTLSSALAELAPREQYLALNQHDSRYDLGVKYGLFSAQMALALHGQDRDELLARMVELLALRDIGAGGR